MRKLVRLALVTVVAAMAAVPASAHEECTYTAANLAYACANISVSITGTGCSVAWTSPPPTHYYCSASFSSPAPQGKGYLPGSLTASLRVSGSGPTTTCQWSNLNDYCYGSAMSKSGTLLLHCTGVGYLEDGWITATATAAATTPIVSDPDSHSVSAYVRAPNC